MQIADLAKVVDNLSKVVTDGFKEMHEDSDLILQTVNEHSTRLDRIEGRLDNIEGDINQIKGNIGRIEGDLSEVKKTVVNLPTKEYVDDKVSALRGDVVIIARDAALNAIGTK